MYLCIPPFFFERLKLSDRQSIIIIPAKSQSPHHILSRKLLSDSDIILGKATLSTYKIVKETFVNITESEDYHKFYVSEKLKPLKLPLKINGNNNSDGEVVLELQIKKE